MLSCLLDSVYLLNRVLVSVISLDMFLRSPYVFVCENGQTEKLMEMEYVLRMVAPILDIVFSDVAQMIRLRW